MGSMLIVNIVKSKTIRLRCNVHSADGEDIVPVSLIYDTGADRTSITRDVLVGIGYTKFIRSKINKRTAMGTFKPYKCTISKLVVGNQFSVDNMTIDVLEGSSSPNFDGVIGMDFISLVESIISGSKKTLEITKIV